MKQLIVYFLDGKWYGEDVSWKRSGSGTYREISRVEVPQSRARSLSSPLKSVTSSNGAAAIPEERQSA